MHWQRKLLIGLAVCICIAIFLVTQWCFGPYREFTVKRLIVVFAHYFVICVTWGLLTIGINHLVVKSGFDGTRSVRSLAVYLVAGLLCSVLFFVISWFPLRTIEYLSFGIERRRPLGAFEMLASLNSGLVDFVMIAGGCFAFHYVRRQRARELNTVRLEAQLANARFNALNSQLQPHFLFNSLNAIASLIRSKPAQAEEMVVKFSELLRSTLDKSKLNKISLREELDFVQRYVEIEKMRFNERLLVEYQNDDKVGDPMVPNLLLHPLIENCIRHGVARTSRPVTISVAAFHHGDRLVLEVSDDGPGCSNDANLRSGIGLQNTRERLNHLYGFNFQFDAGNHESGIGFCVAIELPRQILETVIQREVSK